MTRKVITTILSFVFVFSGLFSFTLNSPAEAATIIQTTHSREYTVESDYIRVRESKITEITQNGFEISSGQKESFSIFNPVEDDPNIEEKKQKTLESIQVTNSSGGAMQFEVIEEEDSNNLIVEVPIQENITIDRKSEIILTYDSYGLIINTGAISDIYIPGFPENFKTEENNTERIINTKVNIPADRKEINFVSPTVQVESVGEMRVLNIPLDSQIGSTTWIQLGKKQFFEFEIKQKLPTTSTLPLAENTFRIPVPRDIESGPITQKVFYKEDELSPKPSRVYTDEDDNLIFEYKYASAVEKDVYIKGYAEIEQNDFNISNAGSLTDIPEGYSRYIQPAEYWEVDSPEIIEVAKELKGESEDVNEIVQNTYEFVIDQIDYSFVKKFGLNERKGALETLNGGAAVCMEYSDLFITLLRAQGVPARAAFGLGYGSLDYLTSQENDINHQWAEVYLPNQDTWVAVDTTWGDFGSKIIGGDLNHFYSHVSSIDPDTPSTSEILYVGNLEIIPDRDMNIYIKDSISEEEMENTLSSNELLDKFGGKSTIVTDVRDRVNVINEYIDTKVLSILGLSSNHPVTIFIKVFAYVLPIGTIFISLYYLVKRIRKK